MVSFLRCANHLLFRAKRALKRTAFKQNTSAKKSAVASDADNEQPVVIPQVTNENLQQLMQQHPILLVAFCAGMQFSHSIWALIVVTDNTQCNQLKAKAWPAAAKQLKGDVTLGWANCDTSADLCTRFSITAKPTSYLLR